MDNEKNVQDAPKHPERELGSEVHPDPVEPEKATDVDHDGELDENKAQPSDEVIEVGGNPVVPEEFDPEGDVKSEAEVVAEEAEEHPRENEGADLPLDAESGDPMQGAPNKGQDEDKWADDGGTTPSEVEQPAVDAPDAGTESFGTTGGTDLPPVG